MRVKWTSARPVSPAFWLSAVIGLTLAASGCQDDLPSPYGDLYKIDAAEDTGASLDAVPDAAPSDAQQPPDADAKSDPEDATPDAVPDATSDAVPDTTPSDTPQQPDADTTSDPADAPKDANPDTTPPDITQPPDADAKSDPADAPQDALPDATPADVPQTPDADATLSDAPQTPDADTTSDPADTPQDAVPDATPPDTQNTQDTQLPQDTQVAQDTQLPQDTQVAQDTADAADVPVVVQDPYDPDYMPKFELVVDADALAVLSDKDIATKKTWVHAAFTCEGETILDVGLRRKGESTFRAVPEKAAFKIKFNKWIPGQKWRGYKELTLNNMVDDATGLRERLGYALYGALNMPASKCNTALVTLNGENYGPYANVETPDTQFTKAKFGDNANTLYEVDWGSEWLPGSEDGMLVDAGPPEKLDIIALFDAVEAAVDANLLAGVEKFLDVPQWLTYCAIEAVIAQHDNYAYGAWGSHNYYLAGGLDGLIRLIPWSVDLSFMDDDGGVDASKPLPADPDAGGETLLQRCQKSAGCWDAFKGAVTTVLTTQQSMNLLGLAQKWHAQIDAEQTADPKRESSLFYYQESVTALYAWIAARPTVVKTQLGLP